jgi:hypothetical protein
MTAPPWVSAVALTNSSSMFDRNRLGFLVDHGIKEGQQVLRIEK